MISGYTGSVRTPRPAVMYSTSSLRVARFISFPFRSATGSMKSNATQHWRSFRINSSSCSEDGTSETDRNHSMSLNVIHLIDYNFNIHLSPRFTVIKSRRLRWEGHVARMEEGRSAVKMLTGKPAGKRSLGRPGCG